MSVLSAHAATIPTGVPLRVEVDHRYSFKTGTRIEGHLIAPVYLVDHQVLPVNTKVSGEITGRHPVDRSTRTWALLNADFTPLAIASVTFTSLTLPDGTRLPIKTDAVQRDAGVVRMGRGGKPPSLAHQAITLGKQRTREALDQITKPGKGDRLLRFVYGQLPYHPQNIWPGTDYDADLTQPLEIPEKHAPAPMPVATFGANAPTGTIEARLTGGLDSATATRGEAADAVLTAPLLTKDKKWVVLPEGTQLTGTVLQVQPARWFARNGKLRFTFHQIKLPAGSEMHTIHGQIAAAEAASGQDISISQEGSAKAGSKNKVLAPLALGVIAAGAMVGDGDNPGANGVASGGAGIVARILGLAVPNRNVARGFAFYALGKSLYRRWIAKGHEVSFPKDTRLEIQLNER